MVRRALPLSAAAVALSFVAGFLIGGWPVGVSAALGAFAVVGNFVANGLALDWAAGRSLTAYQAVGLGGYLVRLTVIFGLLFGLSTLSWFSPLAFGLAAVPTAIAVLGYEASLWRKGLAQQLVIPAEVPGGSRESARR